MFKIVYASFSKLASVLQNQCPMAIYIGKIQLALPTTAI
jgi:hypothetical protein